MATLSPAHNVNVTLLFGPLLLGVLLNTLLYGIVLVQVLIYYHRYPSDRPWFRYLVLYLLAVETVDWVADIGVIYEPLILRYGTPEALLVSPVMLRADAILTVLISTTIQCFVAWRLYVVTCSRIIPVIITLFAIVSFGGGVATTIIVSLHPNFADFSQFHLEVGIWLVSTTIVDVTLAASLVYSLWTRKTRGTSTDSYINKIIRLTVQTGSITAAAALLDLIFFLVLPETSFNFMLDFPLSKLYTNSLLSTLNARPWREESVKVHAANALFEQTTSSADQRTSSFAMVQPRSKHTTTDAQLRHSKIRIEIP
ncbi:hypothetical protein B0H16DRAFT_1861822 [Mycena metata]|uniref:DUF6534 domain-containing protein n=1 Tax=Mycena metata TaxID=1033252 RepID=A0AAD7IFX4_9AGAR|nr:hypothetical protein B0H16DRAFT_1758856 [Mycena metata]KAJ7741691.1 hypothetical protein B0H16DRAFT_1861822 [Mycena metata]